MIRTTLDAGGVLLAIIDMPDRKMNVFSDGLMDAFDALLDRVDADRDVRSVVVTSGKPTFLAGADLAMVRGFTDRAKSARPAEMFELCGRLGRLFVRLETSAKPWVAAINGLALGGGLELALACRVRLATDEARTQLGLPEVRWGLLPGAGGTQRLPRLIGFDAAMDLLLSGRSIPPADAVSLGMFTQIVPAAELLDAAKAAARALHDQPYDANAKFRDLVQADVPIPDDPTVNAIAARHGISENDLAHYPAYRAIIESVLSGARLPLAEATAVEMHHFLRLMFDPVAGRMVRTLYLERLRAERAVAPSAGQRIERVSVGAITAPRDVWRAALMKPSIPLDVDDTLPADTLELVDARGAKHRVGLRAIDEAPISGGPLAVLSAAGPYGRVLEMTAADDATAGALAVLASRLGSLPWRTPGPTSVLQQLHGCSLEVQAMIALFSAVRPGAGEPAFLDVAACLAGVAPAWSGGPLTWLSAVRKDFHFDEAAQTAWATIEPALRGGRA